ncbi:MAG TPA: hypothetical protein VE645_11735 [Pseudonocardiaceae bacterium]|nr:hypothetical protein [Pseudonocardiaceae bacterium]
MFAGRGVVRLQLDLEAFDDADFSPYLRRCQQSGIDFPPWPTSVTQPSVGVLWHAEGYAFSEMTGVLPSHCGQGISPAMKLLAIGFARSCGMRWLRAFHHPCNAAAIGMNRRLGFVGDDPGSESSESAH